MSEEEKEFNKDDWNIPHRRYCAKSGMACAVNHMGNPCPDIVDCEACKLEDTQNNQKQ